MPGIGNFTLWAVETSTLKPTRCKSIPGLLASATLSTIELTAELADDYPLTTPVLAATLLSAIQAMR
jgi:hypothetical protein